MIFFIYNTFWICNECDEPELCGIIDAPEEESYRIREISKLIGEKIEKIHDNHEKNWKSYRSKNKDNDYSKFLKIYPRVKDLVIIKEEFEKFGFKLIEENENNEVRVGKYQ